MADLEKLRRFVESLSENNYLRLRRGFGIGLFLYNQLRDIAPSYLLENLQRFDRMPLEKKKVLLQELGSFLSSYQSLRERRRKLEQVKSKPLGDFLIPLDRLKFLDRTELKVLQGLGIKTLLDVLLYFPLRYEDRRILSNLKAVRAGKKAVLRLRVKDTKKLREGPYTAEVTCTDGSEEIKLRFRYRRSDFIHAIYRRGREILVLGRIKVYRGERYMVHPDLLSEEECGRIVPVYYNRIRGEVTRISSKTRQKKIRKAIEKSVRRTAPYLPEYLPPYLLEKYDFPSLKETVTQLHTPQGLDPEELNSFRDIYHRRMIYEDLFLFQLALAVRKAGLKRESAPRITVPRDFIRHFEENLPFSLTGAQRRVLKEILSDMEKENPMNRLLQGDVGSGKTVVAAGAIFAAVRAGYQAAVMVPTEILARQHYEKLGGVLRNCGITVGLLTGSLTPAQKRSVYRHIREGTLEVVIGTHALIQDKVEFKQLGLVVIDEQHRFGVMQRKLLLEKGRGLYPHCLVMSATPIPRTLALSLYGDLEVSVLDEMPPGRREVRTSVLFESERDSLIEAIRKEVSEGNRVYIVYPLIEESESLALKSAVEEYERWKRKLEGIRVLLLHGRMSDREKEEVMERFRDKGDVLVSTTVIEVGIDIPTATLMIVESAHRFGLSQLHQLRGRVGRSNRPSRCYLIVPDSLRKDQEAMKRLRVLVKTSDGFEVAEMDMKLRGPGELLGVSQSGYFGFNVANLARAYDRGVLEKAREDARELLGRDPRLQNHPDLKSLLLYRYGERMDLSGVA